MARLGIPFVLSAPSGTGKTTLAHMLVNSLSHMVLSVSFTTRPIRGNEQDGVNYHFVTDAEFMKMVNNGEFLEWANVHGHYYGSDAKWTEKNLKAGQDIIFDIDVQGGLQIKKHYPESVTIFILPPSFEELENRLLRRGTESAERIRERLAAAKHEIAMGLEQYDFVINNEKIDRAVFDLNAIIRTKQIMNIDRDKIKKRLLGLEP